MVPCEDVFGVGAVSHAPILPMVNHGAMINQRRIHVKVKVPCALSAKHLTTAKILHRTSKTSALPCVEAKLKHLPDRSEGDVRLHLKASYVFMACLFVHQLYVPTQNFGRFSRFFFELFRFK